MKAIKRSLGNCFSVADEVYSFDSISG